jgi:hypothetical protein
VLAGDREKVEAAAGARETAVPQPGSLP